MRGGYRMDYFLLSKMSYIEEYHNQLLVQALIDLNKSRNDKITRETLQQRHASWGYAFQPNKAAFDFLEVSFRKEFEQKLKKQQQEIDALKKALADTLAALATK